LQKSFLLFTNNFVVLVFVPSSGCLCLILSCPFVFVLDASLCLILGLVSLSSSLSLSLSLSHCLCLAHSFIFLLVSFLCFAIFVPSILSLRLCLHPFVFIPPSLPLRLVVFVFISSSLCLSCLVLSHGPEEVTTYLHIFVYHFVFFLTTYKGIKKFANYTLEGKHSTIKWILAYSTSGFSYGPAEAAWQELCALLDLSSILLLLA